VDAYIRSRGAFYGTVESISETVAEFLEAGCGGFMIFCNDAPSLSALQELKTVRDAAGA
jgi:hypothetical protein